MPDTDKKNTDKADKALAGGLRKLINDYEMSDPSINDVLVKGVPKEVYVEKECWMAVNTIKYYREAFAKEMGEILTGLDAVQTGNIYDLKPMGLSKDIEGISTEELNAISKYASRQDFDATKALTNILRIIRKAERW